MKAKFGELRDGDWFIYKGMDYVTLRKGWAYGMDGSISSLGDEQVVELSENVTIATDFFEYHWSK